MRLFWKLFWALTTAFLAIAAVSSWLGHQWLASSQHAASRLELLEQLGDEAPRFYLEGGPRMLGRWLRRTGRRHHARLFLLDARGVNLLPHPLPPELEAFVRRAIKDPSPRRHIHPPFIASIRPITVEGRRFFWLAATRLPPEAVRESRRQVLLLRAVLSLAAILLLSWALSRMFVRPILGLRHAATRLGEGDLHARLPQELTRRRDELGELARAFNRMAERIERLIESQRRLLRDISHELRSPLARLQAALELARRAPEGHGREELARIEREAQRLDDLIGEVLAMSRLEHESPTDHAEPVDMVALLREVAADAAFEAEAHGKRLRYALEAECAVVRGNRKWLARALDNVLRNAIRHTHEGTAVEVAARLRDERLTIEVRDHGDGV
ncbi:MAG: HAMP domain-containing protein, partial [Zetaproteobacteria bacterium]